MAGIYIHIPFCKQACNYCDFHFSTSLKRKKELLEALANELILRKNELNGPVETIYFGGGTPSLLTGQELQYLINIIYKNFKVVKEPEITIEANPDDLSDSCLTDLSKSQINRLSIGIQSFFDKDLLFMNRAHTSSEAKSCLKKASLLFQNISIDLIYGIPGLNNSRWSENIATALSFKVDHISSYALTVEPKTVLAALIKKGKIKALDDQKAKTHFLILVKELKRAGYIHYEISNFAKPDCFSKHNCSYWQGTPYLGIGPSAHSFDGKQRSWNISNNIKYIQALTNKKIPRESEVLSLKDRYNEYIMTGLRTIWGVSLEKISNEFGQDYKTYLLKQANSHINQGSIKIKEQSLFIDDQAKFLSDGIASDLFMI